MEERLRWTEIGNREAWGVPAGRAKNVCRDINQSEIWARMDEVTYLLAGGAQTHNGLVASGGAGRCFLTNGRLPDAPKTKEKNDGSLESSGSPGASATTRERPREPGYFFCCRPSLLGAHARSYNRFD
jgi:hypothetical protein